MTEPVVDLKTRRVYERPQPVLRVVVSNPDPAPKRREHYQPAPPAFRFPIGEALAAALTALIVAALLFA